MVARGARSPRWLVGAVVAAALAVAAASASLALVVVSHHAHVTSSPASARTVGTDAQAPATTSTTVPVTSVTSTTTTAGGAWLPAGQQGTRAQVPWHKVGTGWVLATWQPAPATTPSAAPTTLVLVDPAGGRYLLEHWNAPGQLADWSGDGVHALFVRYPTTAGPGTTTVTVTVLDIRTGQTASFPAPSEAAAGGVQFSKPDGTAVLVGGIPLHRYSLTGALQLAYPTTFPSAGNPGTTISANGSRGYAESADGTQLALGAASGTDVVANTGKLLRFLPAPPGAPCNPARWQGSSVLLSCPGGLWSQPAAGGPPTHLASDSGVAILDEWTLPTGTLAQAGGCGTWLVGLSPQGTVTQLSLPGFTANDGHDALVGVNGSTAAIVVRGHCTPTGPPKDALMWYDPGNGKVTPLLGGTAGGSVVGAVAWGGTTRT